MREAARPQRVWLVAAFVFAAVVAATVVSWQVGVVVGLALGTTATVLLGISMQRQAAATPHDGVIDFDLPGPDELWQDMRRMRVRLGDDYADFARAAEIVTASQWASVAGLQRDLRVPAARARRLLDLLETEGFVGPPRGTAPRTVLVPADSAPELRRLLHA